MMHIRIEFFSCQIGQFNVYLHYRKSKPIVRWGRKVMDLSVNAMRLKGRQTAESPFGDFSKGGVSNQLNTIGTSHSKQTPTLEEKNG